LEFVAPFVATRVCLTTELAAAGPGVLSTQLQIARSRDAQCIGDANCLPNNELLSHPRTPTWAPIDALPRRHEVC